MPVPEAAVHEDHEPMSGEYKIRSSGEITAMQSEPKAEAMQ
jgi:hypothetical protein